MDGSVKRVNGLLPSVIAAMQHGYKHFFVPEENVYELEYVPGITIYPLKMFSEIVEYFVYEKKIVSIDQAKDIEMLYQEGKEHDVDFAQIK